MRQLPAVPLLAGGRDRLSAIERRLEEIRRRIAEAVSRRRVDGPEEVVLVGASKSQPIARLEEAFAAGLRAFGENRVQEAEGKIAALPPGAAWHLLGPLQSNKAKRAVRCFQTIHSIDRLKIARQVDRHARDEGKTVDGFVQVHLGREPSKSGFDEDQLEAAMTELVRLDGLRIVGLMAIPPFDPRPEAARAWFERLRRLRDRLQRHEEWPHFAGWLSMGMSGDFEVAIEEGATHVRVGTALFGARPAPA